MSSLYVLTLIFACRVACAPATVTLPQTYATRAACITAGNAWVAPAANPSGTVRTFSCALKR